MGLKKEITKLFEPHRQKRILENYKTANPGSVDWLTGAEIKYGGMVTKVKRNKVSPLDPRSGEEVNEGGMTGGDRMGHHGYAQKYAEYLTPFIASDKHLVVAEFGILKGTGLAIWSELFPDARILGLDIDLGHTQNNLDYLMSMGAFSRSKPELHEFDQFVENTAYLESILDGDKIDVCIDDGYHSIESIMCTMKSVMPHLSEEFVYIIEDNRDVHHEIRSTFPELSIDNVDELTIAVRGQ